MSSAAGALGPPAEGPVDLEHEFDLIRSAVALLATGGARRVTLVGLPLDSDDLREVDALVRASGMIMRVLPAKVGCDITVEASG
ncbi:MAG: hypothetical protein ABI978_06660 [Chloroflexota bacterium]